MYLDIIDLVKNPNEAKQITNLPSNRINKLLTNLQFTSQQMFALLRNHILLACNSYKEFLYFVVFFNAPNFLKFILYAEHPHESKFKLAI